ncbi:MAG: SBBP repeat-containing protein [bacterium]
MQRSSFSLILFILISLSIVCHPLYAGQLLYSTFIGGSNYDFAWAMTVDKDGYMYITGDTYSSDFPTTGGAFDQTYNSTAGTSDVFVIKLNPTGTGRVYSTYLGGSRDDYGYAIAIDTVGNAYVTGATYSTNFPTVPGSYDVTINNSIGYDDAYVSKLNPNGTALIYSTYLGGNNSDHGWGIAVTNSGIAYVTGVTQSTNFPTTASAVDQTHNGGMDVFVTKLNTAGTALSYSTFLGGSGNEAGYGITVDTTGNAYITGATNSSNYPNSVGAVDPSYNGGGGDGFLSKLNPTGTSLLRSTFIGGTDYDAAFTVRVADSGNIYLVGMTQSTDFPTTPGAYDVTFNGVADIFVCNLNSTVSTFLYSTYLGGTKDEQGWGLALDNQENAYITGYTAGPNFPTTVDAYDRTYNGGTSDIIISKLNADGTALVYSTFVGGNGDDIEIGYGIGLDKSGNAYVAGPTGSPDFPTTHGAFDTSYNDLCDVFALKMSVVPSIGHAIYSDINNNNLVDQGDTLTLQFDNRMRVNNATASDFYLPVSGNSLGTGATVSVNTANDTQVVITLGSGVNLKITGTFSIKSASSGSPSGIDISAAMTPNAIEDLGGTDAIDGGVIGINDSGQDILYAVSNKATVIVAANGGTATVSTTVNDYYQRHQLSVPAGALAANTTVTAGKPGNNFGYLSAVAFNPPTLSFNTAKPATVTVEYKDADIREQLGYMETGMRIYQWKNSATGWVLVPQTFGKQSVDRIHKTVSLKINKLNMVGATGNLLDDDQFAANTTIVYANIALPTVGASTGKVSAAPGSLLAGNTAITLTVATTGIYTNHKLTLTNYTTAYSGTTVILTQASLGERYGWQNYAVLKIITNGTITTASNLTLEYKDHTDINNQYLNDVIGGYEPQLRISRWRNDLGAWEKLPEPQSVNRTRNRVTAKVDDITQSQIYAVGVDTSINPGFLNSYGAFSTNSDSSHWFFEKYGDGTGTGALSWLETYSGQSGVMKLYQAAGQKAQITQVFSVPSTGWYTATVKLATDITETAKQQKVYLYLQELGSDYSVVEVANQVLSFGAGAFTGAGEWRELEISFYVRNTTLGVQVVGINPSGSGITGSLYIDDIWVTAGATSPLATIPLNNASFSSNTSGWSFQLYADATAMGTWSWLSSWNGRTGILKATQNSGDKGKLSQLFAFLNTDNSMRGSVWVYSGASAITNTQKIYLYTYSYDAGYTKIIESGNAILQSGKWSPNQWQQLQFGYIPLTKYNAVQVVGINPVGRPTQSVYFDEVVLKQD